MNKEVIKKALNGFKWLGNNLHNVHNSPILFISYYKAALKDLEEALKELEKE